MAKLPPEGLSNARQGDPRAGRDVLRALAARLRTGIDKQDAELLAEALERLADDDRLAARNAFTAPGASPMRHRAGGVHRYYETVMELEDLAWTLSGGTSSTITQSVIDAYLQADNGAERHTVKRALAWYEEGKVDD